MFPAITRHRESLCNKFKYPLTSSEVILYRQGARVATHADRHQVFF